MDVFFSFIELLEKLGGVLWFIVKIFGPLVVLVLVVYLLQRLFSKTAKASGTVHSLTKVSSKYWLLGAALLGLFLAYWSNLPVRLRSYVPDGPLAAAFDYAAITFVILGVIAILIAVVPKSKMPKVLKDNKSLLIRLGLLLGAGLLFYALFPNTFQSIALLPNSWIILLLVVLAVWMLKKLPAGMFALTLVVLIGIYVFKNYIPEGSRSSLTAASAQCDGKVRSYKVAGSTAEVYINGTKVEEVPAPNGEVLVNDNGRCYVIAEVYGGATVRMLDNFRQPIEFIDAAGKKFTDISPSRRPVKHLNKARTVFVQFVKNGPFEVMLCPPDSPVKGWSCF